MKQNKERKFAGVWLDHVSALVITQQDTGLPEFSVKEKVHAHSHSSHGSSEHTMNHSSRALSEKFYKEISARIEGFDDIYIFGPGKAQEELFNHLKDNKHFHGKNLSIDSAGNLTDNQVLAKVRDFFKPLIHS